MSEEIIVIRDGIRPPKANTKGALIWASFYMTKANNPDAEWSSYIDRAKKIDGVTTSHACAQFTKWRKYTTP